MVDESDSQNLSKKPDAQEKRGSGNDITPSQEQLRLQMEARLPDKPPKSLVEWLVRVHLRLLALEQEKTEDTS
jgi:hypothetical protein